MLVLNRSFQTFGHIVDRILFVVVLFRFVVVAEFSLLFSSWVASSSGPSSLLDFSLEEEEEEEDVRRLGREGGIFLIGFVTCQRGICIAAQEIVVY